MKRNNIVSRHKSRKALEWAVFISSILASFLKIRLISGALRQAISDVANIDYSVSVFSLSNVTVCSVERISHGDTIEA